MRKRFTLPYTICVEEKNEGWNAFFVLDSLYGGRAIGGIRITADLTLEEVRVLAKEMTNKLLFGGILMRGGAKGGLRIPDEISAKTRKEILIHYGHIIAHLIRRNHYRPGTDLGTNDQDLILIMKGAGCTGPLRSPVASYTPYFTSLSVFSSAKAYCMHHKIPFRDLKVAIEGFGRVGSFVADVFHRAGNKIVAVSTLHKAILNCEGLDVLLLLELREKYSDNFLDYYQDAEVIPKEDLLTLNVDILIPGARVETINKNNALQVGAKAIIPIANVPFSFDGETILQRRGIFYLPGYVSNCGGILGSQLIGRGYSQEEVEEKILEGFRRRVIRLLEEGEKRDMLPAKVAHEWIQKRAHQWERSLVYKGMEILSTLSRKKFLRAIFNRLALRRVVKGNLGDL